MKPRQMTGEAFQAVAQRMAKELQKQFGPGCGFAIFAWQEGALNHVTNDRSALARMMGTQLVVWAQENLTAEQRELTALKEGEGT